MIKFAIVITSAYLLTSCAMTDYMGEVMRNLREVDIRIQDQEETKPATVKEVINVPIQKSEAVPKA